MSNRIIYGLFAVLILGSIGWFTAAKSSSIEDTRFITHVVNLQKQRLDFYWKDIDGSRFGSISKLKKYIENQGEQLVFAMNGGMYTKDGSPQGLYIERGKQHTPTDFKEKGYGNFYLQPNGIFYITKANTAMVCKTANFYFANVKYATQSGPMLLIDGEIHSKFIKGSSNLHIRNAVGILPNGNVIFAMSKKKINFYDLAEYFKSLGCENALYLDGFVSKTYLPQKNWTSLDGNFGVIIAEVKK